MGMWPFCVHWKHSVCSSRFFLLANYIEAGLVFWTHKRTLGCDYWTDFVHFLYTSYMWPRLRNPRSFLEKYCILERQVIFWFLTWKMSIKNKKYLFNQKILRGVVDTHAHIPNMHHATLYHMLCILKVHFGAFTMVNLALKFTKK